ncbi:MAG: PaaI family thioesterase [Actinomycetota bacterium]|nr:PaaI family thioesterase [Actinomycetota bacterium]
MNLEELQGVLATRDDRGWLVPGLEAVSVADGVAVMRVEVGEELLNSSGVLHGGAAATLVDVVGTIAIMTSDRDHRPGVSTDLNISWFAPVPKGEYVLAEATVLKAGRSLAFVSVDLRRESDGVLAAQGRMTKALGAGRG